MSKIVRPANRLPGKSFYDIMQEVREIEEKINNEKDIKKKIKLKLKKQKLLHEAQGVGPILY